MEQEKWGKVITNLHKLFLSLYMYSSSLNLRNYYAFFTFSAPVNTLDLKLELLLTYSWICKRYSRILFYNNLVINP